MFNHSNITYLLISHKLHVILWNTSKVSNHNGCYRQHLNLAAYSILNVVHKMRCSKIAGTLKTTTTTTKAKATTTHVSSAYTLNERNERYRREKNTHRSLMITRMSFEQQCLHFFSPLYKSRAHLHLKNTVSIKCKSISCLRQITSQFSRKLIMMSDVVQCSGCLL